jgi:hypothetical protein
MFKFVRKNKKLIGVVMGVILMIMFLSNLSPQQSSQPNQMLRTVGTVDGQKVTARDIAQALQNWQSLKQRAYFDSNNPNSQPQSLLKWMLGEELVDQIDDAQRGSKPIPLFYLLAREADKQGIIVSPEEVETLVNSHVLPVGDPGSEDREGVDYAVAEALKINHMINRVAGVVKISRPYQEYQLARMMQELTVNVVWINADSYQARVPDPTPAQVQAQYDQYHDRVAARANQNPSDFGKTNDPLGFGYKTPNRVQVQYIGLNNADLRQAAIASKSDQDWYVAAFGEFQAHREDYDGRPIREGNLAQSPGSTTNPSTKPSLSGVQKIEDLKADFALHVQLVLDQLYTQQTRSLRDDVLKEIDSKLSAGFGTYRDAVASGAKPDSGAAGEYTSFKFLDDLAAQVRAKFGVTPITGNIPQYKDIDQLALLDGIGQSGVMAGNQPLMFPTYAIQLFQPWISDADKNSRLGALALTDWQPSNPLVQPQSQNVYVFRISGHEAANIPALADVKQQVIADWKTAQAFTLAQDAAKALLVDANRQGLVKAAAAAKLPAPILTNPFDPEAITLGYAQPVIPPLPFTADSARELARLSQQLLITPASAGNRPALIANLYAERIVSVIALNTAKPIWDEESKPLMMAQLTGQIQRQDARPLALSLFTAPAVSQRMNYVSLEKTSQ